VQLVAAAVNILLLLVLNFSPFLDSILGSQLVENHDCLFDDACAPELALDFDCQNISTGEGILSWFIGMGFFASLFATIKYIEDPPACNPAISRAESDDIVISVKHHD
jgi:hypothetical protein